MAINQTDTVIAEIVARLAGDTVLTDYTVIGEKQVISAGDIFEDLLSVALETDGAAIAVMLPLERNDHKDAPGPILEAITVVDIWFNPFHSLTPANTLMELKEAVELRLHTYLIPVLGRCCAISQLGIKEVDGFIVASVTVDSTLVLDPS